MRASASLLRAEAGVEPSSKASSVEDHDLLGVLVTVLRSRFTPVTIEILADVSDSLIHRHTITYVFGDVWIGDEDVPSAPAPFGRETYLVRYGVNGLHQASRMGKWGMPRGCLKPVLSKQPGGVGSARASAPFAYLEAGKRQPTSERAELDRNTDSAISIAGSPETSIAEAWIERLPRRFDSAFRSYAQASAVEAQRLAGVGGFRSLLIDMSDYPIQGVDVAERHGKLLIAAQERYGIKAVVVMTSALSRLQAMRVARLTGNDLFDSREATLAALQEAATR